MVKSVRFGILAIVCPVVFWTTWSQMGSMFGLHTSIMAGLNGAGTSSSSSSTSISVAAKQQFTSIVVKGGSDRVVDNWIATTNASIVLGDHMESVELLPLQHWETEAMKAFANNTGHIPAPKNKELCFPPAEHIMTDFCCGGTARRMRDTATFINDPFGCTDRTEGDYERLRSIALKHMTPLPMGSSSTTCDVCQIVNTMWKQKLQTHFIGDSVTHQMADGLLCALQRRNYNATISLIPNDGTSFIIHVSSLEWEAGSGVVNMTFFNAMRFPNSLQTWDSLGSADVVVANYGLHWAPNATHRRKLPGNYRLRLNQTFDYWSSMRWRGQKVPRLLAMRETSAQHFDSDSGEYFFWSNQPNRSLVCPTNRQTTMLGWREKEVNIAAKANGYQVHMADETLQAKSTRREQDTQQKDEQPELIWLPFLNYTSELHFMHPNLALVGPPDCTHFCQSPYLWWPVWRSLRLAIDREFKDDDLKASTKAGIHAS